MQQVPVFSDPKYEVLPYESTMLTAGQPMAHYLADQNAWHVGKVKYVAGVKYSVKSKHNVFKQHWAEYPGMPKVRGQGACWRPDPQTSG